MAAASEKFVCIIDSSKQVDLLGKFPLPIEVIPMARSLIGREIVKRGGQPVWRDGVVTDNGNWIIDVHNWQIADPAALESELNQLAGIVTGRPVRAATGRRGAGGRPPSSDAAGNRERLTGTYGAIDRPADASCCAHVAGSRRIAEATPGTPARRQKARLRGGLFLPCHLHDCRCIGIGLWQPRMDSNHRCLSQSQVPYRLATGL